MKSTWPDCPDHVIVRDGINSWSKILKTLCGGQPDWEKEIVSSENSMRVEFVSDRRHLARGFTARYTTSLIPNGNVMDFLLYPFTCTCMEMII